MSLKREPVIGVELELSRIETIMTVKELIEELNDYPQDAEVIYTSFILSEKKVREPYIDYDEDTNVLEIF